MINKDGKCAFDLASNPQTGALLQSCECEGCWWVLGVGKNKLLYYSILCSTKQIHIIVRMNFTVFFSPKQNVTSAKPGQNSRPVHSLHETQMVHLFLLGISCARITF